MAGIRIIGLGPGQEDLMTLRALRALEAAEIVFVPSASLGEKSRALSLAKPYLRPAQEVRPLVFPMVADETAMEEYAKEAARALMEAANKGKEAAFLCLGDPMLYGTGARILPYLEGSGIPVEVIPGVSSFSFAAAKARAPLALGQERLAIYPLAYGLKDLKALLEACTTLVLVKPSRHLKEALALARSMGRVVYRFSEGSLERVEDEPEGNYNYFSLYLVLSPSKPLEQKP